MEVKATYFSKIFQHTFAILKDNIQSKLFNLFKINKNYINFLRYQSWVFKKYNLLKKIFITINKLYVNVNLTILFAFSIFFIKSLFSKQIFSAITIYIKIIIKMCNIVALHRLFCYNLLKTQHKSYLNIKSSLSYKKKENLFIILYK